MARLIVDSGPLKGNTISLGQPEMVVGRSSACDIQVLDRRMSRQHAIFVRVEGGHAVEDLGSKNGIVVNGVDATGRIGLRHGDSVVVGDTRFIYELEPDDQKNQSQSDTTQSGVVKLVTGHHTVLHEELKVQPQPGLDDSSGLGRDAAPPARERALVLYEVSEAIRLIFDTKELLDTIMNIVWEVLHPDRGIVLLRDAHHGTLNATVVRNRHENEKEISISSGIVHRCMTDRVAIVVADSASDERFADNESIALSQIRSAICAPFVYKDDVLGVLYIDLQQAAGRRYTNEHLELLTGIANQTAMAVTNARLYKEAIERQRLEKEMEIARSIQMNLLPKHYPDVEGIDISAMSMPARRVGGDYYDFLKLSEQRIALIIADVSGKGVPAAMLTAAIRSAARIEAQRAGTVPLNEIVAAMNRWACHDSADDMFVTAFVAMYDADTQILEYTNAGHCHPILISPDGSTQSLDKGGVFLGIMEEAEYEIGRVKAGDGDTLILYTDGVTDAQSAEGELFGIFRLDAILRDARLQPPEVIRDRIVDATNAFRGEAELFDDLTLVVVRLTERTRPGISA